MMKELQIENGRIYETILYALENRIKLNFEERIQELQEDPDVQDLKVHNIDYKIYRDRLFEIMFVSYIYAGE
ncbi:hypothetical protein U9W50_000215 [Staphylococcus pseudintermedius]|nr:hypothetical protein [Staphylococcus pseudintermedius]